MHRRSFVQGAVLSVLVSGGKVWRAIGQQGSPIGDGPEFEPWKTWRQDAAEGPLALVRAAILASNAHNTQPWQFKVTNSRIELYADMARNIGAGDPFLREMHVSLGCALENLALAAAPNGYACSVKVLPGKLDLQPPKAQPERVAVVDLIAGKRSSSELYQAIPNRHTNHTLLHPDRPLSPEFVKELEKLSTDDDVTLLAFTADADRTRIIDLTQASAPIYRDSLIVRDTKRWGRATEEEMQQHRDGFLAIPDPATKGLTDRSLMLSGPLVGVVAARDRYDRAQSLRAGRLWQRAHLLATARGVAARPSNGAVELIDYQRRMRQEPRAAAQLAEAIRDASWQPTLVFYMGYATTAASATARRPVSDVVLGGISAR